MAIRAELKKLQTKPGEYFSLIILCTRQGRRQTDHNNTLWLDNYRVFGSIVLLYLLLLYLITYLNLFYSVDIFYLLYFKDDDCISVVSKKFIVEKEKLDIDMKCHVKERGRIYEATVVKFGKYTTI